MLRKLLCGLCALIVCAGVLIADEIKGKIKSVDADKNTIVVTVGDEDKTFTITDDTKIVSGKDKEIKDRLKGKGFKEGANVTITTEKKDGKDVVTQVKVQGGKKTDK